MWKKLEMPNRALIKGILLFSMITIATHASSEHTLDVTSATEIVKQKSIAFEQALLDKDAQAVGELYSIDTKIIPYLEGRESVIGAAQRMVKEGSSLRLGIINVWADDNVIVHDATVEFYMIASGEITSSGHALLIWRNEAGKWRIFRDVYKPNKKTPD